MFIWFLKGSGLAGQRLQQKDEWSINILQCCPKPFLPTALSEGEFPLLPLARLLFLFSRGTSRHPTPRPCSVLCLLHLAESFWSWDALRCGMLPEPRCSQIWDALSMVVVIVSEPKLEARISPLISEGMDSQIN